MGKPWYTSKILWANALAIVAIVVQGTTGFVVEPEKQVAVLGVVNLVLRAITRSKLDW